MPALRPGAQLRRTFASRYGPWAIVAGASEGLGAAFAAALAARGMNLVLLARRAALLADVKDRLAAETSVDIRTETFDLARPDLASFLGAITRDLEVGLGIYNAAYAPIGNLLERSHDELVRVVEVNVRGPLVFARSLAPAMVARGRGGIVLMSSMAGFQGAPRIATYAASKAFNTVLGEGLCAELAPHGIEVLVSCAGAIRTPGYKSSARGDAPGTLDPAVVAERTLHALGRGATVTPGAINRIARFVLGRVLSRRAAVALMAKNTRGLT